MGKDGRQAVEAVRPEGPSFLSQVSLNPDTPSK
jgi:hypothetical protein